ncbi:hypothetical protein PROFUN_01450 [Planoprotostelium fungivorum]|uniref:Uncharacterized protein n=1 Tax=Planoprotostelium fungivorum TaxID=1890364 RepID=A0A2P6NTK5_9EUKA|nr:hypothetical protein PROFUN_01450 [Planoprotostelium fungivorum]
MLKAYETSNAALGPPLRLVLHWIDDMWTQEIEHQARKNKSAVPASTAFEYQESLGFCLLEPLKSKQRKSYENESRFLSPRPVIVIDSSSPLYSNLKRCTVTVKLLTGDGTPLDPIDQGRLMAPQGKQTVLSIAHSRTPPMAVKISGKLEMRTLSLGFVIDYETCDGKTGQAYLTSNMFNLVRDRHREKKKWSTRTDLLELDNQSNLSLSPLLVQTDCGKHTTLMVLSITISCVAVLLGMEAGNKGTLLPRRFTPQTADSLPPHKRLETGSTNTYSISWKRASELKTSKPNEERHPLCVRVDVYWPDLSSTQSLSFSVPGVTVVLLFPHIFIHCHTLKDAVFIVYSLGSPASTRPATEVPASIAYDTRGTDAFSLLEPLKSKQRKSYENESRFLSPRPIIVIDSTSSLYHNLKSCTVTVKLLTGDGTPLDPIDQDRLTGPQGKNAVLSNAHGRTPPMALKISGKSEMRTLSLGFVIDYETCDGKTGQAYLTSNMFNLVRDRHRERRKWIPRTNLFELGTSGIYLDDQLLPPTLPFRSQLDVSFSPEKVQAWRLCDVGQWKPPSCQLMSLAVVSALDKRTLSNEYPILRHVTTGGGDKEWIDELWELEVNGRNRHASTARETEMSISPDAPPPAHFQLVEPLRAKQRKSYERENRFFTPRPIISLDSSSYLVNNLKTCVVTVRLLDESGSPFDMNEQDHLDGPFGKQLPFSIPHRRTPPLAVKLCARSEAKTARLGFLIQYETKDGIRGLIELESNPFDLERDRTTEKKTVRGSSSRRCKLKRETV